VKVLFVGEGPHEIGHTDTVPIETQPCGGVLFALARVVSPQISEESVALRWRDLTRLNPSAKRGLDAKVAAAILLSGRKYDCAGTICVHDRDGDEARLPAMQAGRERGLPLVDPSHRCVCAVAVESIEAWTLGAPTALIAHLDVTEAELRKVYHLNQIEKFKETSEKREKQPKAILQQVAELANQADGTAFRVCVAERTDDAELRRHCPLGFVPFADELIAAFGGLPDDEEEDAD
jgi:hypothetical protein